MTLHQEMVEALDLLDALVDNNLDTITKQRVVTWKKMARDILRRYEPTTHTVIPEVAPTPDGSPPYRGG